MSILNKNDLISSINQNLPDNTEGLITPEKLRTELQKFLNSVQNILDGVAVYQYDEQVDYAVNTSVKYNNQLYIKKSGALAGTTPTQGDDWELIQTDLFFSAENLYGLSRIATETEVTDGTNDESFVTPLKLQQKITGLPVEYSFNFTQNITIVEDLIKKSFRVDEIIKTDGIDTVELNVNGGGYFNILSSLPYTLPQSAQYLIKITYNIGYNSGVVSFNGVKL